MGSERSRLPPAQRDSQWGEVAEDGAGHGHIESVGDAEPLIDADNLAANGDLGGGTKDERGLNLALGPECQACSRAQARAGSGSMIDPSLIRK